MISKKRKQKKEKLEIGVDESAVDVREKQKARKWMITRTRKSKTQNHLKDEERLWLHTFYTHFYTHFYTFNTHFLHALPHASTHTFIHTSTRTSTHALLHAFLHALLHALLHTLFTHTSARFYMRFYTYTFACISTRTFIQCVLKTGCWI